MASKELYTILGVEETASESQIREAYERLIGQYPEGTPMHSRIVQAYTVLSDMDKRAAYDVTGKIRTAPRRTSRVTHDSIEKARYILNTLFLAGAAVTTILFILLLSGSLTSTPFYWACGVSLLIKISEYILRLIP